MSEGLHEQAEAIADTYRIDEPKYSRVSRQTEGLILQLAEAGKTQTEIATIVNVSQSTVSRTLSDLTGIREQAKSLLHNGAKRLAERVIRDANVTESLEVLDRLDVLPKKQRESGSHGNVNIVIGMPGSAAGPDITLTASSLSPSTFALNHPNTKAVSD